jgi:hypothetical protein
MPRISGMDHDVNVLMDHDDLGTFEIGYEFTSTRERMQPVVDWLAQNCTNNFIVTETRSRIAAGGYVDNRIPWKKGMFNLRRRLDRANVHDHLQYPPDYEYRIKLSGYDNVMFRMVWIEDDQKDDR